MRHLLSVALLVALFSASINAQSAAPSYFDGTLIVKFEDFDNVQKLNPAMTREVIESRVSDVLQSHGLISQTQLWSDQLDQTFKRTHREKRKLAPNSTLTKEISRIVEYKYSSSIDPLMLARKISNMPGVEYAEPRFLRMTSLVPNDPLDNAYTTVHKFPEAWDISTGSEEVIIGIIDSGVNYHNQDLKNKAWVNEDEIPDNGIDDDQNGFVDDYLGWDFWESGTTVFNLEEDNDPFAANSDHGTHVAGIATAEANNGIGITGTGYNSKYMAIKAGGIEDDPGSEIDESRLVGFGYDGILYAVANGADIVNLSWGGPGVANAEQDIITFAVNAGLVVVAASGNDNSIDLNSPASYDGVLSVGSITSNSERSSFSNYGYTTDVFAVGSGVLSTAGFDSTTYLIKSGTSMASPVVAGLAGLIKAQNPDWSPRRIIHQIRSSSDEFASVNNPLLFGKGIMNAPASLGTPMPGLSIRDFAISDSEGNSLSVGESGKIELQIANYGETTANLSITLEALQEELVITNGVVNSGAVATDDTTEIEFSFDIPEGYDLSDPPTFVIRYTDDSFGYTDFEVVQFDDLNFGVMNANNVTMSFGANGTIGFSDPSAATGGVGFIPAGFTNILYEAGIIMMAGGNPFLNEEPKISNNVRNAGGFYDSDFDPDVPFVVENGSEIATAEGTGTFVPNSFADLDGVNVRLNTFSFDEDGIENTVYSQYLIKNTSGEVLEDFYMGIFTDWDVDNFANNTVLFDPNNEFMYIYDPTSATKYPFVAVLPMQTASSNLAINNGYEGNESDYRFNIYDGYDNTEKANSLKAGLNNTGANSADVSTVVASGPYEFNPDVTIKLGFMYVYGADYPDLRDKVLASRERFVFEVDEPGVYTSGEIETDLPTTTRLNQNYPNPFNPTTQITFELAESGLTELTIYNVLGQEIQTLVNEVKTAGSYTMDFDASALNSGVYFAVLKTENTSRTIKMTLIK
ncbi:MAG: S8 family serine peptidase [Balneolaceae bacterium]|nr:S8 family serine peptidase [Balneolaceae bacterium]